MSEIFRAGVIQVPYYVIDYDYIPTETKIAVRKVKGKLVLA